MRYPTQNATLILMFVFIISSCIYKPAIKQGHILYLNDIEKVQVGMTKAEVEYLLNGKPIVTVNYSNDYVYLFKEENYHNPNIARESSRTTYPQVPDKKLTIYFDYNDTVTDKIIEDFVYPSED